MEVDKANLDIVVKNLAGKSIDELMEEGSSKLASMPAGTSVFLLLDILHTSALGPRLCLFLWTTSAFKFLFVV